MTGDIFSDKEVTILTIIFVVGVLAIIGGALWGLWLLVDFLFFAGELSA